MDSSLTKFAGRILKDVKFIERQLVRFAKMPPKAVLAHARKMPSDALHTIPHPHGKGELLCGALAAKRFDDVTERILSNNQQIAGRVALSAARRIVRDEYVRLFLVDDHPRNLASAEMLVNCIVEKCDATLQDSEHFLPCIFYPKGGPDEFSIGPVTFIRRKRFFMARREILRESAKKGEAAHIDFVNRQVEKGFPRERAYTPAQSRELVRDLQASAMKIYRGYPWVACIHVKKCDRDTSRVLGSTAIDTALNVVRIILGAGRTAEVRLAWSRGDALRTAGLWADSDGIIHSELGRRSLTPVGGDNWHNALTQGNSAVLQVFGSALMHLADPREIFELHARFIDAINWFGDAATDTEPMASVVKYTSAIERLIFGHYGRDRKKIFATRLKALLEMFDCGDDRNFHTDAMKVYDIRSALLHGASSPRGTSGRELATIAESLARWCILCCLQLYPMAMKAYKNAGAAELEEIMELVVNGQLEALAKQAGYSVETTRAP